MLDNNFLDSLMEGKAAERDKNLDRYMEKLIGQKDYLVDFDPIAPFNIYSGATLSDWIKEMSGGRYRGENFRKPAEVYNYVSKLPLTDVDLMKFLIHVAKGRLHVARESREELLWLVWNGRVYEERDQTYTDTLLDRLATVMETIMSDYTGRASDLLNSDDEETRENTKKFLKMGNSFTAHLRTPGGLKGLRSLFLGNETLVFNIDEHENDSRGYVVEADGTLRHISNLDVAIDPDPSLLIRHTLNVNLTEDWVDKGMWTQFLLETFGDVDEETGEFILNPEKELLLQEMAGIALIGTGESKSMLNLVGPSNAGKSFYLDGLQAVFGENYGKKMANLGIVKMSGTNFYQSEARGVRFLYISEPDEKTIDGPFIKALTGGGYEPVTTTEKGKNSVSWYPQCYLHVISNKPLKFNAGDDALNKRMLTVTVNNVVPEDSPRFDSKRMEKIVAEDIESIYRWVLEGAKSFIANGHKLHIPADVREYQAVRAKSANSPVKWLHDEIEEGRMVLDPSDKAMSRMHKWTTTEYNRFLYWAAANGESDKYSMDEVKEAIEEYTKKPAGKDTTKIQTRYVRLWGVKPGPNVVEL